MKTYSNKISIRNWAEDDKPREKLISKGKSVLSDAELLALLLRSGSQRHSAVELAQSLLQGVSNDLNKLAKLGPGDLMKISGIGQAKATSIIAALELGRRRKVSGTLKNPVLRSSKQVHDCAKDIFYDLEFEEFWILILNRNNELISRKRISQGGVSGTLADSKLIFKYTLEELGTSIIIMHNHPSGNLTPSKADEDLTKKIKRAAENLDIQLVDHIIFYNDKYFSFVDEGVL